MFLSEFAVSESIRLTYSVETVAVNYAGLTVPGFLEVLGHLPYALFVGVGVVIFVAAFFCVWLAFHSINVLILLSPFGIFDLLLRSVKLLILAVLIGSSLIHPYLGLLVALLIVLVSIPLAGWSFRLMVFGSVLAADLVLFRRRDTVPSPDRLYAFTVLRIASVPKRTYGRLLVQEGGLTFSYRRWLVLPERTISLSRASYHLGAGIPCPIVRQQDEGGKAVSVLRFPPRYRSHEQRLVELLELEGIEELPLQRGIKAAMAWLKETAGRGGQLAHVDSPVGNLVI